MKEFSFRYGCDKTFLKYISHNASVIVLFELNEFKSSDQVSHIKAVMLAVLVWMCQSVTHTLTHSTQSHLY